MAKFRSKLGVFNPVIVGNSQIRVGFMGFCVCVSHGLFLT